MIVGVTGGIGSGKSTVVKMFADLGVPVYLADDQAKVLMQTSLSLKKSIINLLGVQAYNGTKLNRTYIANRVFNNASLLKKLNAIVHPAVRKHFLLWKDEQKFAYVIQESAILFENNAQDFYDVTILVTAPINVRIERVSKRDGAPVETIQARIDNQWTDDKKIKLADFCIENVLLKNTKVQVHKLHDYLLANS